MDGTNFQVKFTFGEGGVTPDQFYTVLQGYGWITEENRKDLEVLQIPELSSGFREMYYYQGMPLTSIEKGKFSCYVDSRKAIEALETQTGEKFQGEKRWIPQTFRIDVPSSGNYLVTIQVNGSNKMHTSGSKFLLFGGNRQLLALDDEDIYTPVCYGGGIHICDIIPRGKEKAYPVQGIEFTLVGDSGGFMEISVTGIGKQKSVAYLAGDSTVTNQSADYPYAPGTSYGSWGQMLDSFLSDRLFISNHAHSGLTTETFRSEGHFDIICKDAVPGSYVLFQFGHNDQKLDHLTAKGGYRNNLIAYIEDCSKLQLYPVLVTPLARNSWKGIDGSYHDLLEEYAKAVCELGVEMHVPVLDLHRDSMNFIKELGLEGAKKYFYPGDFTHTNDYGAYKMASFLVKEIQELESWDGEAYRKLAQYFLPHPEIGLYSVDFPAWEPETEIRLPKKPECFASVTNPEEPQLFEHISDPDVIADRVTALDMVIQTEKFFPINVYNDKFSDVIGHEWFAGVVECGCQNDLIPEYMIHDGLFHPNQPVTLEEFLGMLIRGHKSRHHMAAASTCIYDNLCQEETKEEIRIAYMLGLLDRGGSDRLDRKLTKGEAAAICRYMRK